MKDLESFLDERGMKWEETALQDIPFVYVIQYLGGLENSELEWNSETTCEMPYARD